MSFKTVMVYLNTLPEGTHASTNFLRQNLPFRRAGEIIAAPEDAILHRVQPVAGSCLVFDHSILHEGGQLRDGDGEKWIFRSELMYVRSSMPDNVAQAMHLMHRAEEAESDGRRNDAVKLYRDAFRLCPELEQD